MQARFELTPHRFARLVCGDAQEASRVRLHACRIAGRDAFEESLRLRLELVRHREERPRRLTAAAVRAPGGGYFASAACFSSSMSIFRICIMAAIARSDLSG